MATHCIPQLSFKFDKHVVAKFDAEYASADGGAVLLKAIDGELGVTATVAGCLRDRRQPGKVQHDVLELVRQRVFGLVCGYADCNDAARLAHDPRAQAARGPGPARRARLGIADHVVALRECRGAAGPHAPGACPGRSGHRAAARCAARAAPAASRSISIPRTIPPTGSKSSPSSTATTTPGATCRCLGFVSFDDEADAVSGPGPAAAGHQPRQGRRHRAAARTWSANCARPFRARGCACGWMAALPATRY